jgi:epoxide hydrolase 4
MPHQASLNSVMLPGRLPPSAMFPAGDSRFRVAHMSLKNRIRVRTVECGPTDGPVVVCLPGWSCSAYTFRSILPAVGAAGYRAVAIDLKGHGLSDKPLGRGEYTREAMTTHVLEVLDAMRLEPVVLVGHSMGCAVALHVTIAAPERTKALALLSPVGLGPAPILTSVRLLTPDFVSPLLPWLVPRWAVKTILRTVYGDLRAPTERDVDEYWAPSQFPEFAQAMRALVHYFVWTPMSRQELERITVPCLVMFGARDRVITVEQAEDRRTALPNSHMICVERAGHVLPEEAPEEVNRALLQLLHGVAS